MVKYERFFAKNNGKRFSFESIINMPRRRMSRKRWCYCSRSFPRHNTPRPFSRQQQPYTDCTLLSKRARVDKMRKPPEKKTGTPRPYPRDGSPARLPGKSDVRQRLRLATYAASTGGGKAGVVAGLSSLLPLLHVRVARGGRSGKGLGSSIRGGK